LYLARRYREGGFVELLQVSERCHAFPGVGTQHLKAFVDYDFRN
jgi:hypothetical protein